MLLLGANALAYPDALQQGIAYCEEALASLRTLNYPWSLARALTVRGELARLDDDRERAQEVYREARAIYHQTGDRRREGMVLSNLGHVMQREGDTAQAESLFLQAIELMSHGGSDYFLAFGLAGLAGPLAAQGNAERAARLLGTAEAVLEKLGVSYQPADRRAIEHYTSQARAHLGSEAFERAWAEGRAASITEAVADSLSRRRA
jgi:tetratricopeptide (TPR) repeat protein